VTAEAPLGRASPRALDAAPAGSPVTAAAAAPASVAAPAPVSARRRQVKLTIRAHAGRFVVFGAIGLSVFLLGIGLQFLMVRGLGMGTVLSFFLQGVISVQVSFVLNYYWTWGDRRYGFWRGCWRFNVQKSLAQVLNLLLYAGLVRLGMEYLVANLVTTVVFTFVNYVFGHYWIFTAPAGADRPRRPGAS